MNLQEIDRLVRAGWTLRLAAGSELYVHRFSAYLDGPPESDIGHCAVGSTAELALLQLEHYVSQQRPAKETAVDCPKCGYKLQSIAHFEHCGHGHVVKRHDGMLAKCGGPLICNACAAEKAAVNQP